MPSLVIIKAYTEDRCTSSLPRLVVVQKNFNNYDPIRIDEMPVVEVHIVPSRENPGGSSSDFS